MNLLLLLPHIVLQEPAIFQWTKNSVTAKDSSGRIFFTATFSNTKASPDTPPNWFLKVANGKIPTIQWPINDALTRLLARIINDHTPAIDATIEKLPTDVQKMLRAGADAAQARADAMRAKAGVRFLPNTQTLSFPGYFQLAVANVSKVYLDGTVFTGPTSQRVGLMEDLAGVVVGTPGALSDPEPYSCY